MKIIIIALAIVSVSFCQEETLIQLSNGARLTNLHKLMSLDYSQIDCTTNLLQLKHELKMWGELYEDEKVIHHEIKMLSTAHKVLVQSRFDRHRNSNTLLRAKRVLAALRQNTHKKQHTIYQQWRLNEITDLKNSIQLLQNSASEDESKQCCDRLEQQINKFLEERKHVAKQCGNTDVTINIINDAEGKIEIVQKKCKDTDPDIKINRLDSLPQQVIVGQKQEQKKEVVVQQPVQQVKEQVVVTKQEQVVVSQPKKEEVVVQQPVVEQKQEQVVVSQPQKEEVVQEQKQVVVTEQKQEQVVVSQPKTEEVVVTESKQSEQVVVKSEEKVEEVVTEEQVVVSETTKTETTKVVSVPDDEDEEEVVGEAVQTQGIAASGEKGRQ